jgi:hypothetical protein
VSMVSLDIECVDRVYLNVVRPKSWTLGIINSRGPIKECTDEETPQVHTRVQSPGDT